jgi:hypothetical protein
MEFAADPAGEVWNADRSEVTRTRSLLTGCAFAFQPELSAPILARAQEAAMPVMSDTPPADPQPPLPDPEPAPTPAPEPAPPAGLDSLQADLIAMRGELARIAGATAGPAPTRFRSLGEIVHAAARDDARPYTLPRDPLGGGVVLLRAWTDTTFADVPGLLPKQRLSELMQVVDASQPLVDAAGTLPPPTRLTYTYPQITQRPQVAAQTAEKTEIASREIKIVDATAPVSTFAGGTDVSIQVIQLSEPSYLEIQAQLYAEEMARATDAAAIVAYAAAVPATHKVSIGAVATAWNQELFDLAALIATDSRRFPDRLVLSVDLWAKLGGAADSDGRPLFPAMAASNPVGSASLTSPEGEVRALRYTVDPNFPADRGAMFASAAFRAGLGPVQTMTVDVPRLLGRDYAMFRFGAFAAVDPNGLGLFATGVAPTAEEGTEEPAAKKK